MSTHNYVLGEPANQLGTGQNVDSKQAGKDPVLFDNVLVQAKLL